MYLIDVAKKLKCKYGDKIYISIGGKEITNEDYQDPQNINKEEVTNGKYNA